MSRRAVLGAALLAALGAPAVARAQPREASVELFDTVQGLGGVGPVRVGGATKLAVHGGVSLDGGLQGDQLALGFAFRFLELRPTSAYGGGELGFVVHTEWRPSYASRTTLRLSAGAAAGSFELKDSAQAGGVPASLDTGGLTWSVGVGHELPPLGQSTLLLSADLVIPPVGSSSAGPRAPVLELGVGYRWRFRQGIGLPRAAR